eukprot:CAMPEP_0185576902 /NCGR_PEP_ID=MMETSP0434-20130131/7723_1 /TAXON_ID=626734 ORGANISM="Favella taraikaensis, Strain Fe Narragansett Bay" /NCGR_SAMPLE_ID=MMETSP0434 /ASSEMBLY_ACC=CAM_ASM_000379 /LENGTH=88 /DNA_ID=CAMNT_0028194291 /DNA_START=765 /DNA_END=1031 /DNA_ORIENTATION=-
MVIAFEVDISEVAEDEIVHADEPLPEEGAIFLRVAEERFFLGGVGRVDPIQLNHVEAREEREAENAQNDHEVFDISGGFEDQVDVVSE